MKLIIDGMEIEIKVKPAGKTKADEEAAKRLVDEMSIVYTHAANFIRGNGMQNTANYYLERANQLNAAIYGKFN